MKLKYEFELMEVDDNVVAVPIGDESDRLHGIVRLNGSAADIFRKLMHETTEEKVVQELSKEYIVDEEMKTFVHDFIGELDAAGVLEK